MNKKKIVLYVLFLLMFVIILFQMVGIGKIESSSMSPALDIGNVVIINKLAYALKEPQRGDVVSVKKDGVLYIKRIVGLPEDKIEFVDGSLVINGYVLMEPYLTEDVETNFPDTIEVGKGEYLLLGDSREESRDGRYWEEQNISKNSITGRVVYCFKGFSGETIPRYKSK